VHQPIEEFLARIEADKKVWQFAEIRLLTFRIKGHWHNRFTRIRLRSGEPLKTTSALIDSDPLWAERVVLPADRLTSLLEAIQKGEWKVRDRVIHYIEEPFSDHPKPPDRWNTWTYASDERHNDKHGGDGCQFLSSYGGATTNLYTHSRMAARRWKRWRQV